MLLSYIVVSEKFKLKLISAKFLRRMICRNELSITLSTLWLYTVFNERFAHKFEKFTIQTYRFAMAQFYICICKITPYMSIAQIKP